MCELFMETITLQYYQGSIFIWNFLLCLSTSLRVKTNIYTWQILMFFSYQYSNIFILKLFCTNFPPNFDQLFFYLFPSLGWVTVEISIHLKWKKPTLYIVKGNLFWGYFSSERFSLLHNLHNSEWENVCFLAPSLLI